MISKSHYLWQSRVLDGLYLGVGENIVEQVHLRVEVKLLILDGLEDEVRLPHGRHAAPEARALFFGLKCDTKQDVRSRGLQFVIYFAAEMHLH